MIIRIDATLPHLATKAELAEKPSRAYLWGVMAAMVGAQAVALAAAGLIKWSSPMFKNDTDFLLFLILLTIPPGGTALALGAVHWFLGFVLLIAVVAGLIYLARSATRELRRLAGKLRRQVLSDQQTAAIGDHVADVALRVLNVLFIASWPIRHLYITLLAAFALAAISGAFGL
jgi:hypothetical protein